MTITEKAAYLKGLADGLNYDKESAEGKLIAALIELTSDLAELVDELDEDLADLEEYVDEIDTDLGDVEDYLLDEGDYDFDEDDEDWDEDWDEECDGDCSNCGLECDIPFDEDFDDEDEDDEDYEEIFEVECPSCGEIICFEGDIDEDNLRCPACGEKFACIIEEDDVADLEAIEGKDEK